MTRRLPAAVCIVGGGPAGSTVARRLSQVGHAVVLVEKRESPRPHIGESLSAGIFPSFDALNLRARIESEDFLRPTGALLHWPPVRGFKDLGSTPGFQVDRARFDQLLLESAAESGAAVFTGARVAAVTKGSCGGWDVSFTHGGRSLQVAGCFLVDATGRASALAGSPWARKTSRDGCATLALSAYWAGLTMFGAETRIEAGEEEWFWGAPLPDGRFNATVFVDAQRCRREARTYADRERLYLALLGRSALLAPCLRGRRGALAVHDATCQHVHEPIADDVIRIGEASFSIDPLSSQGVQAAMASGIHAAAVIHTILARPEDRAIAEQFYRDRQREAVSFHRATAADAYRRVADERGTPFWRHRAIGERSTLESADRVDTHALASERRRALTNGMRFQLDPRTSLVPTPALQGAFIRPVLAAVHPGLPRPTAFIGDVPLAPLLECLRSPQDVDDALRLWSAHASIDRARRIMDWLWSKGIIVAEPLYARGATGSGPT